MERPEEPDQEQEEPEEDGLELPPWDPEELPRIYNAVSLDQAELSLGQLMALRFSGEGIDRRGASLHLVATLLDSVNRVLTGLQPVAAGVQVKLGGAPPRLPGIEPPSLQAAVAGRSITFVLGLTGEELNVVTGMPPEDLAELERHLPEPRDLRELPSKGELDEYEEVRWAARLPTITAAHWFSEVLASPPDSAAERVQGLGRRATRDYLKMTDVLSKNHLDTDLRSIDRPRAIRVPSERSWATAEELRRTEERIHSRFEAVGALYQADALNHRFRLITEEGRTLTGTYVPGMLAEIREGWAKLVRVRILRTDFQWVGADQPHKTQYQLEEILRVLGEADNLLTQD